MTSVRRFCHRKDSNVDKPREAILKEVLIERELQDAKWGEQNHYHPIWLAILQEETGEVSKAFLESTWAEDQWDTVKQESIRSELIQSVAVGVAWIECMDRGYMDRGQVETSKYSNAIARCREVGCDFSIPRNWGRIPCLGVESWAQVHADRTGHKVDLEMNFTCERYPEVTQDSD